MWLLLIMLSLTPGTGQVDQIKSYVTKAECEADLTKVTKAFALQYPGDESWAFVCIKQKEKEA